MQESGDVTVIGAGIVGVCCARYLQLSGLEVALVDRVGPGESTSFGNASIIASTHAAIPLPSRDLLFQVPRMLTDKKATLIIRWSYLPRLLPWLIPFLRACNPAQRRRGAQALYALLAGAPAAYDELARRGSAGDFIRRNGALLVFDTDQGYEADAGRRRLLAELGVKMEPIDSSQLRQIEPALADSVAHAILYEDAYQASDPFDLVKAIAGDFSADGGTIVRTEVTGLERNGARVRALRTVRESIPVERLVIAAGAWSGRLCKELGISVPLDTERGYHLTLEGIDSGLRRPLLYSEGRKSSAVTQLSHGLRFAGTVEFAGLDAPPNYERADNVFDMGRHLVRDLDPSKAREVKRWMGYRPTLPDYLPVVGEAPGFENAWLGFGHQHLGLTMGARTGAIIADLVNGRDPGLDIAPFSAERF